MPVLPTLAAVVAAYLVGAIPFGLLVARSRGVDIRKVGSGNTGATNVVRAVGKPWGILTFVLDLAKGTVASLLFPWCMAGAGAGASPSLAVLCGIAAVAGHNWPVYLRFKGGKGVATSAGVLLGIAPLAVLLGLAAWGVTFLLSRYVSLASLVAAAVIAGSGWWLYGGSGGGLLVPCFLTGLAILVIGRHRANISRLLNGTEHRFVKKPRQDTGAQG